MPETLPKSFKAVILHPPARDIRVEEIPMPQITDPDDAIVKIKAAGLCGSDLHAYRAHRPVPFPHSVGHEFVGHVVALGASFRSANASAATADRPPSYANLKIGDMVIASFSSSCEECDFCRMGFTCRCAFGNGRLFGTPGLNGGQAQYILVPKAGGTLFPLHDEGTSPGSSQAGLTSLSDASLLLLADIVPTGYFAALQLLNHPNLLPLFTGQRFPDASPFFNMVCGIPAKQLPAMPTSTSARPLLTVALVGLGPVGVCALVSLLDLLTTSNAAPFQIVAIDPNEARCRTAENIVEHYWSSLLIHGDSEARLVFADIDRGKEIVKSWQNCGVHGVIEVVGNPSALELSYELIRPFGVITSVGGHYNVPVPFMGAGLYDKNVSLIFGRCPARALLPRAAELLQRRSAIFTTVGLDTSLVERIVPLDIAREAYDKFDKGIWGKVIFDPWMSS